MVRVTLFEAVMDNKINEFRSKISILRSEMLALKDAIRLQVDCDEDCSETAFRLMGLRRICSPSLASETPWAAESACSTSRNG
jgi:hypothetical protein